MKLFTFETIKKTEIISGNNPWSEIHIRCRFSHHSTFSPIEVVWLEIKPVTYQDYRVVIKSVNSEKEIARFDVERCKDTDLLREAFGESVIKGTYGVLVNIHEFEGEWIQLSVPAKVVKALTVCF